MFIATANATQNKKQYGQTMGKFSPLTVRLAKREDRFPSVIPFPLLTTQIIKGTVFSITA